MKTESKKNNKELKKKETPEERHIRKMKFEFQCKCGHKRFATAIKKQGIVEQFRCRKCGTLYEPKDAKQALDKFNDQKAEKSYHHAKDVIKGRFKQGENAISENAEHSYNYALNVIKGRFERGEKTINKNSHYAELYAKNVLKME
jgi:transcription elongation factor Elf1